MSVNPYANYVAGIARLFADGKSLPLGGFQARPKPKPAADAKVALIFSPHPDDECIVGGLALRLLRETGTRVVNVAVTLGSDKTRRQARLQELKNACDWLGFELETAGEGLEKINPASRSDDKRHWAAAVRVAAEIFTKYRPRVIFLPHEFDVHPTHCGTYLLVMDALRTLPADFQCHLVETEFWGQMRAPNLMVESSVEDVADLVAALSFHVGEVKRNPYHLRLPAWMQDNVRRGAELVGGHGGISPEFIFATLYRVRLWKQGLTEAIRPAKSHFAATDNLGEIFKSIC